MVAPLDYTWAAGACATKAGVDPGVMLALINAESSWNPNAVSPTGATGLGQFILTTAGIYGLAGAGYDNRRDPALNMTACAMYLADLYHQHGTWRGAVGEYSGQGTSLSIYATYQAGQALIAAINTADGTTSPTPQPQPTPTPGSDQITSVSGTITDSTGKQTPFSWSAPAAAIAMIAMLGGGSAAIVTSATQSPAPIAETTAVHRVAGGHGIGWRFGADSRPERAYTDGTWKVCQ